MGNLNKSDAIDNMVKEYTKGIKEGLFKDGYVIGLGEGFETGSKWAWQWIYTDVHEPEEGVPLLCCDGYEPIILYRKGDRYFSNFECDVEFLHEKPKKFVYLKYTNN